MATTSGDYPAKGNAVTYVAETLNISRKEAYKWLCQKYNVNNSRFEEINSQVFAPAISHTELMSQEFPPARFTVNPLFEQGTMNMVSAPPNTWKSWLLFHFAGHIVIGTPVLDKFATEKSNVMIVNEEDSARSIQDRLRLLKLINTSLPIYYRISQGSKLESEFVDNLIKEAKEKNIGVIMFDSLRAIHTADENSSKEMQVIMDLFKRITRESITVIFTHHHRKKNAFGKSNEDAESSRGSSAINAAISGHISLNEVIDEDERYLIIKHLKSKAGEKHPPFDVEIKFDVENENKRAASFRYLGEHKPQERAFTVAKEKIVTEISNREELLGRKDFVNLGMCGMTTAKMVTKSLVGEKRINPITRKEAVKQGYKTFSEGKSNEKLYLLVKDEDLGLYDIPPENTTIFKNQASGDT